MAEATKPEFWPGNNLFGIMLMDITEEQLCSFENAQTAAQLLATRDPAQQQPSDDTNPDSAQLPATEILSQEETLKNPNQTHSEAPTASINHFKTC